MLGLPVALVAASLAAPVLNGTLPGPLPLFPPDNWWNADVSTAPVDPASAAYIGFIGPGRGLHPDFGGDVCPGCDQNYGFSWIVVDGSQPKRAVEFLYADESDGVDPVSGLPFPFYPIPDEAIGLAHWVEGGDPGNVDLRDESDRHILVVDRDSKSLYELWNCWYDGGRPGWSCGSGAFFDLGSNARRPEGWTSADAAGLAILPGLMRYDDFVGPAEIGHALRVTVRATNGHVFPASHDAGSTPGALPMGARLRLAAGKDITGFDPDVQRIFRAMKRYGLIVADNGTDLYVSGSYDNRWDNDVLNPAFAALKASDFEVIQLGWIPPAAPPAVTGIAPAMGTTAGGTTVVVTGTGFAPEAAIRLGGAPALVLSVPDSTRILAVTPSHAAGPVDVAETNPDASGAALAAAFTYCEGAAAAPAVTAPLMAAIGETGLVASASATPGSSLAWTVIGGALTGGQGTEAITFDAGPAGTRMLVGVVETGTSGCASATGARAVQVDFLDVPPSDPFRAFIDTLARNRVTSGCAAGRYCPVSPVTRAQMAVFLLRGEHGSGFAPPPASGRVFADVAPADFAAAWIETLAAEGITSGCAAGLYCPGEAVTRAQMAIFLLRARHGALYQPPPATGAVFTDVPAGSFAAAWIEQFAAEGITSGCGAGRYCPGAMVTRGQMAVFLVRAFSLE